jgi:hypothetical protein
VVLIHRSGPDKTKIEALKPMRSKGRITRNYTGMLHRLW